MLNIIFIICRYLDDTRKWFRTYKIPDGKPENNFAFEGAYKDKAFADQTIADTFTQWQTLIRGGNIYFPSPANVFKQSF